MHVEQGVRQKGKGRANLIWIGALALVVIILALAVIRVATGRSLGLRSAVTSRIHYAVNLGRAVLNRSEIVETSRGDYSNVVFLHHSVGNNLILQGKLREELADAGIKLWDHGYNEQGLRGPDGKPEGYHYNVPWDNTDPDGYGRIFTQQAFGLPLNTLSGLLQHEVIAFKSCYTGSDIVSDEDLARDKSYYLSVRNAIDQHPDKLFIVITPAPRNPAETDPESAARARAFANWLMSEEFRGGRSNIALFDLFDLLAESDPAAPDYNTLRAGYRNGSDSHPNQAANEKIGPLLAKFIADAAGQFRDQAGGS